MTEIVPARFLFRWAFPVPYVANLEDQAAEFLRLPESGRLPSLRHLDGIEPFATIALAWNEQGLAVTVEVRGKKDAPHVIAGALENSDGLRLWIDTRGTQNVHRATRFCHAFVLTPPASTKKGSRPMAMALPLGSGGESASSSRTAAVQVAHEAYDDGYALSGWFPAGSLVGYDPESHPRLGFYAAVSDAELGDQFLTVGEAFPFANDPSLWQTLELVHSCAE